MKEYSFRVKADDKFLKKKSFKIKVKNKIDDYDLFEKAGNYIEDKLDDFFNIPSYEEYFEFYIIRGKKEMECWVESYECPCCGGSNEIGWSNDF